MPRLGIVWALDLLLGCSYFVSPEELPILCNDSAGCPNGMQCQEGVCREESPDAGCTPDVDPDDPNPDTEEPERCDGEDNDCDGVVDEGNDRDGDGTTWCGGGQVDAPRDCDDNDPRRSPELEEVCNGIDDDCDGKRDNGVCPQGEICFPDGSCARPDCRSEGEECPQGERCTETGEEIFECREPDSPCSNASCPEGTCDEASGLCLGSIGQTCVTGADCLDGLCLPPTMLRLDGRDSLCSRLCCSASDCPEDTLCWQPGGGLSACVPRELLNLHGSGEEPAGADCDSDGDCVSGTCVQGSCWQVCCDESACPGNLQCNVIATEDDLQTVCTQPAGGQLGDGCSDDRDCDGSICLGGDEWTAGYCSIPCCTSEQCDEGFVCREFLFRSSDGIARLCAEDRDCFWDDCWPRHGDGRVGAQCSDGVDCRSDMCEQSVCVDTCCVPSDCPARTECTLQAVDFGGQLLCRPAADGPE